MDNTLIVSMLAVIGATLGSFAGAQVWRLRARQLQSDKAEGEPVDAKEYRRLKGLIRPASHDRSECLSCHHQLAWYDLLPLVSWLSTGGKCRYCRAPIGTFEPLMEVGVALALVTSYLMWPVAIDGLGEMIRFCIWIIACVLMAILFAYDAKWSLLPFGINVALIGVSAFFLGVSVAQAGHVTGGQVVSGVVGLLILSGLYFGFSLFGWVGTGDAILGIGLALVLFDWKLAFLAVFLANLLGCLMLIPLALKKTLRHNLRIPFGPFLITGTFIAMFWGHTIISYFLDASMHL